MSEAETTHVSAYMVSVVDCPHCEHTNRAEESCHGTGGDVEQLVCTECSKAFTYKTIGPYDY